MSICSCCLSFLLLNVSLWQIVLVLGLFAVANAQSINYHVQQQGQEREVRSINSHSCIHDQIIAQRRRPGRQVYSVTPQVYEEPSFTESLSRKGRALLGVSESIPQSEDGKWPIRIYLNYDAVGHSPDRDCRNVGDIVKVRIGNGGCIYMHIVV